VRNANQIKHVENLGTWNPKENNIYRAETPVRKKEQNPLINSVSITDFLTPGGFVAITKGDRLSSKTIL